MWSRESTAFKCFHNEFDLFRSDARAAMPPQFCPPTSVCCMRRLSGQHDLAPPSQFLPGFFCPNLDVTINITNSTITKMNIALNCTTKYPNTSPSLPSPLKDRTPELSIESHRHRHHSPTPYCYMLRLSGEVCHAPQERFEPTICGNGQYCPLL